LLLTSVSLTDKLAEERIEQVTQKARNHLSKESQKEINAKYREYLLERGDSIHALNRNPLSISTDFTSENEAATSSNLKRPASEDAGYQYAKQPRYDAAAPVQQQQAYAGYGYPQQGQPQPYAGGDYYGQQAQQQPWQP
jgi:hypothetical protein